MKAKCEIGIEGPNKIFKYIIKIEEHSYNYTKKSDQEIFLQNSP